MHRLKADRIESQVWLAKFHIKDLEMKQRDLVHLIELNKVLIDEHKAKLRQLEQES